MVIHQRRSLPVGCGRLIFTGIVRPQHRQNHLILPEAFRVKIPLQHIGPKRFQRSRVVAAQKGFIHGIPAVKSCAAVAVNFLQRLIVPVIILLIPPNFLIIKNTNGQRGAGLYVPDSLRTGDFPGAVPGNPLPGLIKILHGHGVLPVEIVQLSGILPVNVQRPRLICQSGKQHHAHADGQNHKTGGAKILPQILASYPKQHPRFASCSADFADCPGIPAPAGISRYHPDHRLPDGLLRGCQADSSDTDGSCRRAQENGQHRYFQGKTHRLIVQVHLTVRVSRYQQNPPGRQKSQTNPRRNRRQINQIQFPEHHAPQLFSGHADGPQHTVLRQPGQQRNPVYPVKYHHADQKNQPCQLRVQQIQTAPILPGGTFPDLILCNPQFLLKAGGLLLITRPFREFQINQIFLLRLGAAGR